MSSAYVELHCASAFSFLRGASVPETLAARAAALGMPALALTDHMTLAGIVRHQAACADLGLRAIAGVELAVADPVFGDAAAPAHLVVLARDRVGYVRLCTLLTDANLGNPRAPIVPFSALAEQPEGLIVLTGGHNGTLTRLILAGRIREAEDVARRYAEAFGRDGVWVELQHHRLPESIGLMRQLVRLAESVGLGVVATNDVYHATREEYALRDLMTCARLGITVDTPHGERPCNDEAYLKSGNEMAALFAPLPWGEAALAASAEIAAQCDLSLLRGVCVAPRVPLPEGETSSSRLRALCLTGLAARYGDDERETPQRRQLEHELTIIERLELEEFFLCVQDIVSAAHGMGIRCSGRGSAANSIAAYCLGITGVDPLAHGLLFERFLNPDRRGMPDIDIDVQSDRREELIRYVERTYSERHAAMVANVNTYRPRSAMRDAAKALGFPFPLVNRMTKVLHHHASRDALPGYHEELARVVAGYPDEAIRARCLARLPLLLDLTPRLCGLPRHLSLHNGGMVLTREPLTELLPVRVSANGVRALEVDKDDVERLGLIKFDLLGLRTLGAIEEALALIEETTGARPDIDHLPLDDPATFRLIRSGQTLAVFQIESPGQWHLLAQTQPRTFDDLIVQTALFRPGPLQANMVHPYVERREKQRDAVQTPWHDAPSDTFWTAHPVLGQVLADTEGILLFQEQILEIAHQFAGLSYADADGFRRAMSHSRMSDEMEAMRERFVSGATRRGESTRDAARVFDAISAYVGYGFCKSHAAEFARTIYQTAWLKAHYPAHYLAAFLSSQPAGFFPPHVVLEEAKRLGVPVLGVEINRSEDRFTVERVGRASRWAIRIGLRQVAQVGEDLVRAILWERRGQMRESDIPFASLADFCTRMRSAGLTRAAAEALALAGAFDGLHPGMERRRLLWHLRELWPLVAPPGKATRKSARQKKSAVEQMAFTWEIPSGALEGTPRLPALDADERTALEYRLMGLSARPHPVRLLRRSLRRRGIAPIAELADMSDGHIVRVAGWAISAQRPPTAKGMGFLVLEDETGRLPVAVPPKLAAEMYRVVRSARVIVAIGRVESVRWYRSLLAFELQVAEPV